MCGILVIAAAGGVDRERARTALETLAPRGPDGVGEQLVPLRGGGELYMGHRRLAILELTSGARQPFRRGDTTLCFNGEIYNYVELKAELSAEGHRFELSNSDTEVLATGLEQKGAGFLERLDGMFAGVAWSAAERELHLFRDPAGQKPLVLYREGGLFVATSEPKALHAYRPGIELDPERLARGFLLGYDPDGGPWRGVEVLAPGHRARVSLDAGIGTLVVEPCPSRAEDWEAEITPDAAGLTRVLERAVERHLRSDVPLGHYLSGGVDSTLVLQHLVRTGVRPRCFTIGFEDPSHDETRWARRAAERFDAPLEVFTVAAPDLDETERVLDHFDEPFYDSSAIPTAVLNREAARHVKVVLGGDGGDELFCGYRRYALTLLGARIARAPLGATLLGLARSLGPRRVRVSKYLAHARHSPVEALFRNSVDLGLLGLFEDGGRTALGSALERYAAAFDGPAFEPTAIWRGEVPSYLSADILTKADRCSMLYGLEQRAPLLDAALIRLAARLPARAKVRRDTGKLVLKELVARDLGNEFAFRRKQGFVFPLRPLLVGNESRVKETLADGLGPTAPLALRCEALLAACFGELDESHLERVWRAFVLARFLVRGS